MFSSLVLSLFSLSFLPISCKNSGHISKVEPELIQSILDTNKDKIKWDFECLWIISYVRNFPTSYTPSVLLSIFWSEMSVKCFLPKYSRQNVVWRGLERLKFSIFVCVRYGYTLYKYRHYKFSGLVDQCIIHNIIHNWSTTSLTHSIEEFDVWQIWKMLYLLPIAAITTDRWTIEKTRTSNNMMESLNDLCIPPKWIILSGFRL